MVVATLLIGMLVAFYIERGGIKWLTESAGLIFVGAAVGAIVRYSSTLTISNNIILFLVNLEF